MAELRQCAQYVRNELGRSADPAAFVQPGTGETGAGWTWQALDEPELSRLPSRGQQWEMSRYYAYQARLAGHDVARTFARCADFLAHASSLASMSPAEAAVLPGTEGTTWTSAAGSGAS